jgi:glucose/arabinose dehydrogenase
LTVTVVASLALVVPGAAAAPRSPGPAVPAGFRIESFARGLSHPTAMAYGPDGKIYVTESDGNLVSITRGTRKPGLLLRGLRIPLGVAWHGRTVFISEEGRLERAVLSGGHFVRRKVLVSGLPFGEHQQDNLVFRDGRLYVGSGSTCDACREHDPRSAAVLSLRPDGRDLRVYASGLRNPYGLAVQPRTGRLYATVNGQDKLGTAGDPEPADTLVLLKRGAHYGWPHCWADARTLRLAGSCRGVTPPAAYFEPHASADGVLFYSGTSFPRAYKGDLFAAEWGQYYSRRFGRRVVRVDLGPGGRARRVTSFASGFEHPLALLVDRRGGMLVADWGKGIVYRIQADGRR